MSAFRIDEIDLFNLISFFVLPIPKEYIGVRCDAPVPWI
jgi:hypothetical protein